MRNPHNVDAIVVRKNSKGMFLEAHLHSGEIVKLTKEKSRLTFPFNPFEEFRKTVGVFYMENFLVCNEGFSCININNFVDEVCHKEDEKTYTVLAKFSSNKYVQLPIKWKTEQLAKEKACNIVGEVRARLDKNISK